MSGLWIKNRMCSFYGTFSPLFTSFIHNFNGNSCHFQWLGSCWNLSKTKKTCLLWSVIVIVGEHEFHNPLSIPDLFFLILACSCTEAVWIEISTFINLYLRAPSYRFHFYGEQIGQMTLISVLISRVLWLSALFSLCKLQGSWCSVWKLLFWYNH